MGNNGRERVIKNVREKLSSLLALRNKIEVLEREKRDYLDSILTSAEKSRLTGFDKRSREVEKRLAEIERDIKEAVLVLGETVKGDGLMAVWNRGRVTWDNRALEAYAKANPDILEFRREGEPSVTIRRIE